MEHSEPTRETEPSQEPYNPPTIPSYTVAVDDAQIEALPTPPPPRRRRRRRGSGCWPWVRTTLAVIAMGLALVFVTATIIVLVIYNSLAGELQQDMATLQSMQGVEHFQTTRIYDRDGTQLYEIFDEGRRTEVPLDQIPFAVRWATIATEDDTFYDNPGFDPQSIARAAYDWYSEGEIVSGGSTITQQLIRQIVFSYQERNEQTLRRKLKEAALAWVMTRTYDKDRILEIYLNEVYYGNLAYGIESAADVYFDKHARDLTIAESAFLVGMVQSPVNYDPYVNFEAAKARQRQVLDLMVAHGYLKQAEADAAFMDRPLLASDLASPDVPLLAPHYTVAVRNELAMLPGMTPELIARGGLKVYTALSMPYQELGEKVVAEQVAKIGAEANLHNAALVAINPNTGEVLAMVGSVDYNDLSIDGNVNVIMSPQQPGSSIKPLTYAAAFEHGMEPASILWDVPVSYPDGQGGAYEPHNYDFRWHGPVRVRDALANSYNIPAVETLNTIGVPALLEIAKRFGIESFGDDPSQYGLALTLGGRDLTPLELASAYAVFANGGHKIQPHVITRVEDSQGNVIYEAPHIPGDEVLDPRIAFEISSILSDNAARTPAMGPDSPLKLDFPAAVKTGTTNDYRDNWTVGYTPHLVVGVWAGNTDNSPMAEGTSGLTGAAPIWHEFITAIYNTPTLTALLEAPSLPPLRSDFTPPEGMEQREVCILSSLRDPAPLDQGCPHVRPEWFRQAEPEDLLLTPTTAPTATWTPIPPVEGEPPKPQMPYVRVQIEPGIWGIAVLPIDEPRAATLTPIMQALNDARPKETPTLNNPLYCEVPQDRADAQGMSLQIFIDPPADPALAIRARNWAWANGVPIIPGVPCPADAIVVGTPTPAAFDPSLGLVYNITFPQPGQGVYGVLPILGTANFDANQVNFYKIEISGGSLDGWVTLGDIHNTVVSNGPLETLHADALPPGNYIIRLVLVAADGNYVQPTYDVPIIVLAEPPTPTPTATP